MSINRPSKCSAPMFCTTSCKCRRMRASQAVHSRDNSGETPGRRFRHARVPSCSPSFAHPHLDAGRCCGRKSHALAAPSGRVGIRPPSQKRRIRLPRCVLHCSHYFAANGAILDELVLLTGLAPLLEMNLRAEPCEKLHATDASPSGAGGCVASIH